MMIDVAFPRWAHVPGRTQGPDSDRLAGATLRWGDADAAIAYGLMLLQEGFYWEAHEALEPVWTAARPNSVEKRALQALIQFANARLKIEMGRKRAVLRLLTHARMRANEGAGELEPLVSARWLRKALSLAEADIVN